MHKIENISENLNVEAILGGPVMDWEKIKAQNGHHMQ